MRNRLFFLVNGLTAIVTLGVLLTSVSQIKKPQPIFGPGPVA